MYIKKIILFRVFYIVSLVLYFTVNKIFYEATVSFTSLRWSNNKTQGKVKFDNLHRKVKLILNSFPSDHNLNKKLYSDHFIILLVWTRNISLNIENYKVKWLKFGLCPSKHQCNVCYIWKLSSNFSSVLLGSIELL